MQLGALNKIITLYETTSTTLASGQKTFSTSTGIELFANVSYSKASENYQADQKTATQQIVFTTHNVVDNYNTKRLVHYNSQYYNVESITPIDNDMFIEITATVRDNGNIGV